MAADICMPPWLLALLVTGQTAVAGLGGLMAEPPEDYPTHRSGD